MAAWRPRKEQRIVIRRRLQRWWSKWRRSKPPVKILVVDDEPAVCSVVKRLLEGEGYAAEIAHSPSEALNTFVVYGPFDLLLTDENMPEARGHQLATKLRRLDPDLCVLYMTGYSDMLFADRSTLSAREAYIDKPVSARSLSEAISLLLSSRSSD